MRDAPLDFHQTVYPVASENILKGAEQLVSRLRCASSLGKSHSSAADKIVQWQGEEGFHQYRYVRPQVPGEASSIAENALD